MDTVSKTLFCPILLMQFNNYLTCRHFILIIFLIFSKVYIIIIKLFIIYLINLFWCHVLLFNSLVGRAHHYREYVNIISTRSLFGFHGRHGTLKLTKALSWSGRNKHKCQAMITPQSWPTGHNKHLFTIFIIAQRSPNKSPTR